MQPTLASKPFSDPNWLFEPKWDGFRALLYVNGQRLRYRSRRKTDLTRRFPELQAIQIKAESAIIDGEITAIDETGLPCFDELKKTRRSCAILFYAFDLLVLNGEDLRCLPLLKRKAALKRILYASLTTLLARGWRFSLNSRNDRLKEWLQRGQIPLMKVAELERG